MNWTRTVLDGFAMAAYFNLFAGLVALYIRTSGSLIPQKKPSAPTAGLP